MKEREREGEGEKEGVGVFKNNGALRPFQRFGILIIVTFSAILWLSQDKPVVSGGGNWSIR